jgi:uncharacterized delta-60 repeat protein
MIKIILNSIAVFVLAFSAFTQPGDIDVSFNTTDIGFGNGDGTNNGVYCSSIQSDGKIIFGGTFTSYNGSSTNRISRINTNGSIDNTFNIGLGANGTVLATAIQGDGKIILGGNFSTFNGIQVNKIVRLNEDGSIDTTFNSSSFNSITNIKTIVIQSNGKIIIGGSLTYYFNGIQRKGIARLNLDGTLDGTFSIESNNYTPVNSIAIQNDGKIVVVGDFSFAFNGTAIQRIARLNTNGTLDNTFIAGGATGDVYSVLIQSDQKIIVSGMFEKFNGIWTRRITRLNTDGTTDPTFNSGTTLSPGTGVNGVIFSMSLRSDGKIIIGGAFTGYYDTAGSSNLLVNNRIARLNANGTLDQTFNSGSGANLNVRTTSIQSDGKILIGGDFDFYNSISHKRIARINSNGVIDASFNFGSGANLDNGHIRDIAIQSDGKILIGGDFTKYNGVERRRIARLNSNGSIDYSFDPGTGVDGSVNSISIQSDGKILIGGSFPTYNGISKNGLARINSDGSLDFSLNISNANTSGITIYTTNIQSDGKIIIGGMFNSVNSTPINRLARLSSVGDIDNSFNTSMGNGIAHSTTTTYPFIKTTAIQNDGKLIIGGSFTSFNFTTRNNIARLNNGALDLTFNPGTGFNNMVSDLSIQSDGKIIAVGTFTSYNGTSRNRIVRINSDGSIDTSFDPGIGANDIINAIAIQSDGKIIIAGSFTSYNGLPANQIARLNQDGSLDVIFNIGIGANQDILSTVIQNDGKIIIGGQFTAYNNIGRNRIARVFGGSTPIYPVNAGSISGSTIVCLGQNSVTYTVPTIVNATYYIWTLPNGVTGASNTNSITVNYGNSAVSGNITVKGVNTSGEGSPSSIFVSVNPLPSNAGSIIGSTIVCQGQNSVIYTVPSITNATSYVWTLSNGASGTSNTNSILVNFSNSSTSDNITVKGLNSCGMGITSSLSINIESPVANASIISGLTNVCQGQTSVVYSVDPVSNSTSYLWTLPNGASGTSSTNSIIVDFGVSGNSGNVIVNGTNSCGNGLSSTLSVNVNSLPAIAGIITGASTICQGQNLVTYSLPTINDAISYVWSLPNGATGSSSTNIITVNFNNLAESGDITVYGVNSCGNGGSSTSSLIVNQLPSAAGTISGLTAICTGQNSVTYSVPPIANASNYIWSLPNGVTGSSNTNTISVDFSNIATTGNISVYGTNSCGAGNSSTSIITVNPLPIINTNPTDIQVNIGNQAIFTTSSNATNYQWQVNSGSGFQNIFNGGQFSGATSNNLTVYNTSMSNDNNQFRCEITANNCSTTSNSAILTVVNNVGINDFENKNIFELYPNPSGDFVNLKSNLSLLEIKYEIVDNAGRIVLSGVLQNDNQSIDVSKLSRGIYNLNVIGSHSKTMKLVKN